MRYPHYVRISVPGEPTEDEATGRHTAGPPDVRYLGRADVQDGGAVISRDPTTGTPTKTADAELFIPRPADVEGRTVLPEMVVEVLWNPEDVDMTSFDFDAPPAEADVQTGQLRQVRRLEGAMFMDLDDYEDE